MELIHTIKTLIKFSISLPILFSDLKQYAKPRLGHRGITKTSVNSALRRFPE